MEQIKRPLHSSVTSADDNKRQKIQITTEDTNCLSKKSTSRFEDLSNEVMYEIFEFLDYFHAYEAFFNINRRFHHLLTHLNLPIQINLSSISKSALKRYNTDIIQTNMHRISSLHVSHVFMYEFFFSLIDKLSEFDRIERLILDNIEYGYLQNLLDRLPSLPFLSSLVIASINGRGNNNTIYHQIFRLPALKYCKLSLGERSNNDTLSVCTNVFTPIEHLIITNYIYFHELDSVLSYVPHLRRLSLYLLANGWDRWVKIPSRLLNHLTHVSIKGRSTEFDQFEELIINIFRSVQVLHFTLDDVYPAYLDANKWEQLLLSHMPNLRIFDVQLDVLTNNNHDRLQIETQMNQFLSPFWTERQWFFCTSLL